MANIGMQRTRANKLVSQAQWPVRVADAGRYVLRDGEGMKSLNVGVDAWIIQDGNYSDFTVVKRRVSRLLFEYESFLFSK